jgi:formylglycine-generating enzyme required for sulfatase activity
MKFLFSLLLCGMLAVAAFGQPINCYDNLLKKGIDQFNQGNYAEAKRKWEAALDSEEGCPNLSSAQRQNLNDWLAKARLAEKPVVVTPQPTGITEPETVLVQGGTFQMGDTFGDTEADSNETIHTVKLNSFRIGKYELSVGEFKAFIDDTNYKTDAEKEGYSYVFRGWSRRENDVNWRCDVYGTIRPLDEYNHPVIHVSWNDATEYCKWLSRKTGKTYRLPTETEWEFSAREGGKKVRFGNGKDIADPSEINFECSRFHEKTYSVSGVERLKTVSVNSLTPNALGLYHMSGNVWEFCGGRYKGISAYYPLRGGCWSSEPVTCRASFRNYSTSAANRGNNFGFRVALSFQ